MPETLRIEVVFDTICPWCFIGHRRLQRALSERPNLPVELSWRPFLLNPDMPAAGMSRAEYMARKFGSEYRARRVFDAITEAGKEEDIVFDFGRIEQTPNTVESHRLVQWAAGPRQTELVERMFTAYFRDGEDLGDRLTLVVLAKEAGLDPGAVSAYLDSDRNIDLIHAENLRAHRAGISGVPCFTLNSRYAIAGAQEAEVFLRMFDLHGIPAVGGLSGAGPLSLPG
jgi:predicted DsbA family dithiol-disulfide isomerase